TYAGNIGPAQGLESLLEAATLLADVPDVMVALIGDGSLAPVFQERIGDLGLRNVTMIPYQPFARVPEIYATSDLSIVAQVVATGADAVPSKLYRIMAAARPILAITAPDSDVARLVREADCGYVATYGDAGAIAAAIRQAVAAREELPAMGRRGRARVLAEFERRIVTGRYEALLCDVVAAARR